MNIRDFAVRKCFHVKLLTDTHAKLRIELFKYKLSMQEVFEEIAQRIVIGDSTYLKLLDEVAQQKRDRIIKQLSSTDAHTILDAIEMASSNNRRSKPK